MGPDVVKIRVRSGSNEVEIEADLSRIREALELIPEIIGKFPAEQRPTGGEPGPQPIPQSSSAASRPPEPERSGPSSLPSITIEKGDSLGTIVAKFFDDRWGRSPRSLGEVREALQSYGLSYPKQSVAVALLRLAKSSRIRRFKGGTGEYVYTTAMPVSPLSERSEPVQETMAEAFSDSSDTPL